MSRSVLLCLFAGSVCASSAAFADEVSAEPQVFAPGAISGTATEDCLSFTPDGNTAIYDVDNGKNIFIVISHNQNGVWSKPEIAPFSGQWMDHDPAISPDGKFLVYVSNRPAKVGGPPAANSDVLWRVERKGDSWSEPERLPDTVNATPRTYAPSIAADGSLYYIRPNAAGILHIYRSQYRNGSYAAAVEQVVGDPAAHEKDPAIAPDESFIVFDSDDPVKKDADRFFIAFHEGDHWGKAIDLGDAVNAGNNPWGPHLGPDGRTLYYTSDRTVPVNYPRSPAQAEADFARLMSWDNGENNIWYISLTPWIRGHGELSK
jgi:Tol biopolymer transport system component